jgi:hypothetical protein
LVQLGAVRNSVIERQEMAVCGVSCAQCVPRKGHPPEDPSGLGRLFAEAVSLSFADRRRFRHSAIRSLRSRWLISLIRGAVNADLRGPRVSRDSLLASDACRVDALDLDSVGGVLSNVAHVGDDEYLAELGI